VPIDETLEPRPINAYGETKLAVERALPHLERAHGLRWTALRYFNAAGAHPDGTIGEDHHPEIHIIPRAIEAATGGRPLPVFGEDYPTPDGTCLRDYIHVCDLAAAHVCALRALTGGGASGSFNVGTGQPHSVKQVIDTVSRVADAPVRWSPARRGGDRRSRRCSTPRATVCSATALAAAIRRARHHRSARLAMASGPIPRAIDAADPDGAAAYAAALRRPATGSIAGATLAMLVYGPRVGGAGVSDQADHRRGPSEPESLQHAWSPASWSYFLKGIGGYFSNYLMDDPGTGW
jgi:hypothetical protein